MRTWVSPLLRVSPLLGGGGRGGAHYGLPYIYNFFLSCSFFASHFFSRMANLSSGVDVVAVSPCYPPFRYLGNFVSSET